MNKKLANNGYLTIFWQSKNNQIAYRIAVQIIVIKKKWSKIGDLSDRDRQKSGLSSSTGFEMPASQKLHDKSKIDKERERKKEIDISFVFIKVAKTQKKNHLKIQTKDLSTVSEFRAFSIAICVIIDWNLRELEMRQRIHIIIDNRLSNFCIDFGNLCATLT